MAASSRSERIAALPAAKAEGTIRVLVWNVESLTDTRKFRRIGDRSGYIAEIILKFQIDLCLIMETGPDVEDLAGKILTHQFPHESIGAMTLDQAGYYAIVSEVTGPPSRDDYGGETYCAIYRGEEGSCTGDLLSTMKRAHDGNLTDCAQPKDTDDVLAGETYYRGGWLIEYQHLTFCVCHYPSPRHHYEVRQAAIQKTRKNLMRKLSPPRAPRVRDKKIIFCGDFNIKETEVFPGENFRDLIWIGPKKENETPANTTLRQQRTMLSSDTDNESQPYDRVMVSPPLTADVKTRVIPPEHLLSLLQKKSATELQTLEEKYVSTGYQPYTFTLGLRGGSVDAGKKGLVKTHIEEFLGTVQASYMKKRTSTAEMNVVAKKIETYVSDVLNDFDAEVNDNRQLADVESYIGYLMTTFDSLCILDTGKKDSNKDWSLFRYLLSDHLPVMVEIPSIACMNLMPLD